MQKKPKVTNNLKLLLRKAEITLGKKVTQKDLAEFVGVSKFSVFRWTNNVGQPEPHRLSKIAEYLGCKMEDISNIS